jgi:hypothetical protein
VDTAFSVARTHEPMNEPNGSVKAPNSHLGEQSRAQTWPQRRRLANTTADLANTAAAKIVTRFAPASQP